MVRMIDGTENGYLINSESTVEQFDNVCRRYGYVRSIICNFDTAAEFQSTLFHDRLVTVNNTVPDGQVFINWMR